MTNVVHPLTILLQVTLELRSEEFYCVAEKLDNIGCAR